jgi:drug/metabolite transporter (DMT)-like permease
MIIQSYIWIALFISFLWGIGNVIHKHLLEDISGLSLMLYSSIIYAVCIIATAVYNKSIIIKDYKKIDLRIASILFFTTVLTTYFSNVLYFYILKSHETSIISALVYSSPVFTVIFAYLFLNERLSLCGLIGIFMIILGTILINVENKDVEYFAY